MNAKVAAHRSTQIRLRNERAAAKKEAAQRVSVLGKARKLARFCIKDAEKEIAEDVEKGDRYSVIQFGDDEVNRGAASILAAHFRKKGYRAEVKEEERDMGDSAAPCRTTLVYVQIAWGRQEE